MPKELQAIEVEVVAIDGAAPPMRAETREAAPRPWQDWQSWQGRVRELDSRWWPLWVFLGVIAVGLLVTVGVVIGIVFVIFRVLGRILRALFR